MITMERSIDVEQIKDEIRKLNPSDKTEICRWIDHEAAVNLLSRIGVREKRKEVQRDRPKRHVRLSPPSLAI